MTFHYERTYRTGRFVSTVLEGIFGGVVILGFVVTILGAIYGFSSLNGAASFGWFTQWSMLMIGIGTLVTGLFGVLSIQALRAILDIAEMTRDSLAQQKRTEISGAGTGAPSVRVEPKIGRDSV